MSLKNAHLQYLDSNMEIMHNFKDDAFDDNNNVIKSIYHVLFSSAHGLEWTFRAKKFRIVGKKLPQEFSKHCLHAKHYCLYCQCHHPWCSCHG
jgi:hypothetical protein